MQHIFWEAGLEFRRGAIYILSKEGQMVCQLTALWLCQLTSDTVSMANMTDQIWRHLVGSPTSRIPSSCHRLSDVFQTRHDATKFNPVGARLCSPIRLRSEPLLPLLASTQKLYGKCDRCSPRHSHNCDRNLGSLTLIITLIIALMQGAKICSRKDGGRFYLWRAGGCCRLPKWTSAPRKGIPRA